MFYKITSAPNTHYLIYYNAYYSKDRVKLPFMEPSN